jgi:hypothetical protein
MEHRWNETGRGKQKYWGKTCPSATLSTTNLTWTDLGSNPGLRGERPATNRLSHGKVKVKFSLEEAMKAHRESRGVALLFL